MKIAIGTLAPPKVEAIKESINKCVYFKNENIEFFTKKVDSNVSDMPKTLEENMAGAKNRALNLQKEVKAEFYIGMEGGTTKILDKAYLFGVVYILDKNGNGHFGISNMMEVPKIFEKGIYEDDKELGIILDEITKESNVSKKNGAFGVWSDDMLTRKDQFVFAFLSGIVGFYNKYYKM